MKELISAFRFESEDDAAGVFSFSSLLHVAGKDEQKINNAIANLIALCSAVRYESDPL